MSRFPTMRRAPKKADEAARSVTRSRAAAIVSGTHGAGTDCNAAEFLPYSAPRNGYVYCDTCRAPRWTETELLARLEA